MTRVYTFKIVYIECENKIWRDIQISSKSTLAVLGYAVLSSFSTCAYHLFMMTYKGTDYELDDEEFQTKPKLMSETKLGKLKLEIGDKISGYSLEYREVYTDVYTALERFTKRSVRSIASRGAAEVTKGLGKIVENIPKLSDTQIDENLLETSAKIKDFDVLTNQKISRTITNCQKVDVSPFIDNINRINYLCNSPLKILVSEDKIYIA